MAIATQGRHVANSLAETASFFGVGKEVVRSWIARGCPAAVGGAGVGGEYDLAAMLAWCKRNIWRPRQSNETGEGSGDESKAALEREKLKLENEQRRLRIAKMAGDVVDREAAKAEIRRQYAIVRARLESIPGELSTSVPPDLRPDVLADWKHRIRLTLKELETLGADE